MLIRMRPLLALLLIIRQHLAVQGGDAERVQLMYKVNQKQTECLYDHFEEGEVVTFSVFVVEALMNGKPIANIKYEGPVAGNSAVLGEGTNGDETSSLGRELRAGYDTKWPKVKDSDKNKRFDQRIGVINRQLIVDWTHAGESEDAMAARAEMQKNPYRDSGRGPYSAKEKELPLRTVTQAKIEPYQETRVIKARGYYRVCVASEYHPLVVEMDMRCGSKLGGVDQDTGHVFTEEKRQLLDDEESIDFKVTPIEERQLDANTYATSNAEMQKEIENQVREQDLHATTAQMKHLNTLVSEMKKFQQEMHHRIKSHEAGARRNYEGMIWIGKLETLLYFVIMGAQIYTLRSWLLSNTLLGK